jgi:hypothetical protein
MEGLGHARGAALPWTWSCVRIWVTKHTNAGGAGRMAGAQTELAIWRCAHAQGLRATSVLARLIGIAFFLTGTVLPEPPIRSLARYASPLRWPPQDGQPAPVSTTCFGKALGRPLRRTHTCADEYCFARERVLRNERQTYFVFAWLTRGLTFDMRGDRKAQPFGHPFDGRVRPHSV